MAKPRVIITGGAGFIGSNFARMLVKNNFADHVTIVDKLTYAGTLANIRDIFSDVNFVAGDICSPEMTGLIDQFKPDIIFNFAAETHVDNSIADSGIFMRSNIIGVKNILDAILVSNPYCRFVQISTDEVYGQLGKTDPPFTEDDKLEPRNPYSASKASADLFVLAYKETYDLDVIITRCCNNFGPNQHLEKFLPKMITNALLDKEIPVYGKGEQVREWIYVEDHCAGIWDAGTFGTNGFSYNFGSGEEYSNIELTKLILKMLDKPESLISFVIDRKGHDFRYAVDSESAYVDLNWTNNTPLMKGLQKTIDFYSEFVQKGMVKV